MDGPLNTPLKILTLLTETPLGSAKGPSNFLTSRIPLKISDNKLKLSKCDVSYSASIVNSSRQLHLGLITRDDLCHEATDFKSSDLKGHP